MFLFLFVGACCFASRCWLTAFCCSSAQGPRSRAPPCASSVADLLRAHGRCICCYVKRQPMRCLSLLLRVGSVLVLEMVCSPGTFVCFQDSYCFREDSISVLLLAVQLQRRPLLSRAMLKHSSGSLSCITAITVHAFMSLTQTSSCTTDHLG